MDAGMWLLSWCTAVTLFLYLPVCRDLLYSYVVVFELSCVLSRVLDARLHAKGSLFERLPSSTGSRSPNHCYKAESDAAEEYGN